MTDGISYEGAFACALCVDAGESIRIAKITYIEMPDNDADIMRFMIPSMYYSSAFRILFRVPSPTMQTGYATIAFSTVSASASATPIFNISSFPFGYNPETASSTNTILKSRSLAS